MVNRTSISENLKSKIQEYYPSQQERIIDYLERILENDFNQYKAFKGYTPNETLLKITVFSLHNSG